MAGDEICQHGGLIIGQPVESSHIAFLPPPTVSEDHGSGNLPISNNNRTLQARIELQKEKIRALEVRRRTEQLRTQEQRLAKRRETEQMQ
jgi:hypothetical protein